MTQERVSLFRNVRLPKEKLDDVPVEAIAEAIRTGRWAKGIERVRTAKSDEARKGAKLTLPAITFSGTFKQRNDEGLTAHSGLVCLDFDKLDDPETVKAELAATGHARLAFLSPSGTGIKAVVRIRVVDPETGEERAPATAAEHKTAIREAAQILGLEGFDEAATALSQACYVSHDPDPHDDPDAVPIVVELAEPAPPPVPANGEAVSTVRSALQAIPARPGYDDWIRLIAGTLDALHGDTATADALLREWSPEKVEGEYARKLENPLTRVTAGTLYWMAEKHGWQAPWKRNGHTEKRAPLSIAPISVASVQREPIDWLWYGRLAHGKITVLDGDPGLGKSTVTYDLSARVSRGAMPDEPYPPDNRHPFDVLIVNTEDGIGDTIRPRLEAAGADLNRVHVLQEVPDEEGRPRVPIIPDDLDRIGAFVEANDVRLVIFDPLMAHLGSETNSYRDQDVRRAMAPLSVFAERHDVSVLLVRHLNKSSGGNAVYRGGGSIGIIGAARIGLLVAPEPSEEGEEEHTGRVILASSKNNLAPAPESLAYRLESVAELGCARVFWDGSSVLGANQLLRPPLTEGEGAAVAEAIVWLQDFLQDGPQPAADVKRRSAGDGIAYRTLRRAKDKLSVELKKDGFGGAWIWQLPEGVLLQNDGHLRGNLDTFGKSAELAKVSKQSSQNGRISEGVQAGGNGHLCIEPGATVTTPHGRGTVLRQPEGGRVSVEVDGLAGSYELATIEV